MAVQRRASFTSQLRVDVPLIRSVESAASNDWDQFSMGVVTNTSQGYIVRGFEISMTNAIGNAANNLQLVVDPGAVMHILASQSGTVLMIPPGTPSQQLNGAINTNVSGSFVANSVNYVGLDYTRFLDTATDAQSYFWDPTADTETSMIVPQAKIMTYALSISTAPWSTNILPIAIVNTDASNNATSITDCRWLLFRLGTGGASPNPFYVYPWTAQSEGRTENPSTSSSDGVSPFEGGDKMLFCLKDWMNAIMTSFLEIKGTPYWYSALGPSPGPGSITKLREDTANTFTAGKGTIAHGILPNNDPVLTTTGTLTDLSNQITSMASTAGLVAGQFIFATGVPYGTTIVSVGSGTVTMSQEATQSIGSASISFYNPSVVTQAGQINWSDPIYLNVVGTNLSYEIAANPTSDDIVLADNQVAYITLGRDIAITPNLFYQYYSAPNPLNGQSNTTVVTSIGSVVWTTGLAAGDYLRAYTDQDNLYTEIQDVYSTYQVVLYGNYVSATQTAAGVQSVYTLGSYQAVATPSGPRDIYIANRPSVPNGQNTWWLMARNDEGGNATVYVKFIGQELAEGDSNQIDDGFPKQVLQYIGSPMESASAPQYSSALNPGSIPQITNITTGAASAMASNEFFYIYSSGSYRTYYVWVNKDGTGVNPIPAILATGLEWSVATGQTAAQTAASLAALLLTTSFFDFSAVASSNVVTVTNNSAGVTTAATNATSDPVGGLSISTIQSGTGTGNYSFQDGDNLTLAIKKIDDVIVQFSLPGYDQTVVVVSSGATPPTTINGPVPPSTNIQLPNNARLGSIPGYYEVGSGKLEVLLNGQKLILGNDYTEVGIYGSQSNTISNNFTLVVGDELEFIFLGGAQGSQGPPGPPGPAGSNAVGGPISISTKTANYNVLSTDNVLLANCSSNVVIFTLPPSSSSTGRVFWFKKIDSSSNAMIIAGFGTDTIDGASAQSTFVQYTSFTIMTDGSGNWYNF